MAPIKVSQISTDFNIKTKDVTELFKDIGIEKKSGAVASDEEFALFLEHVTSKNQIKNMADYLSGKTRITNPNVKKPEPKAAETQPAQRTAQKPAQPKPEQSKPEQSKPAQPKSEQRRTEQPVRDNREQMQNRQRDDRRNTGDAPYRRYNERPQENPFARKLDNMNKNANGRRPQQNGQNLQKPEQAKRAEAPKPTVNTARPAQVAQEQRLQRQAKPQPTPVQAPKKEVQKAQKQQFKKITPTIDLSSVKGGVNLNVEISSEKPKTRVVDMRQSDVNLSKYDDRYNDRYFQIANGTDTKASKQKLKKQDNRGQNIKSAKDKQRVAQEKIKQRTHS